jgi:hydroxymethylpyrimidine/phosphomethylpyrimidine kinase
MSAKSFSIDDRTLIEIISDAENKLESKLNGITSSSGLMDFIIQMSNMWSSESFPIKGEDSFGGDTAKYYIFKNIIKSDNQTVDVLLKKNGKIKIFKGKKADVSNTHGTGCSFSASIASLIARDKSLCKSIKKSKQYIYKAIKNAPNFGRGNGPINHIL